MAAVRSLILNNPLPRALVFPPMMKEETSVTESSKYHATCRKTMELTQGLDTSDYLPNFTLHGEASHEKMPMEECLTSRKTSSSRIKTLQIQLLWMNKYRSKGEVKRLHHETVYKNVLPILTEIVEATGFRTADKESLYRKIVIFIIMFSGLGSPTQESIIKETLAALNSILRSNELDKFMSLSKPLKEEELLEFARIVTGIRVFNKDCKKGGSGIEDLPFILTQGAKATKDRIEHLKAKVEKRIGQLLNVFWHVYGLREVRGKIEVNFGEEKLEEAKDKLIYYRQTERCLKDMIEDLNDSMGNINQLVEKFELILLQIHDVVRYRVAIATVEVFPLFVRVSDVWVQMQEEVNVLSEINNRFVDLSSMAQMMNPGPLEKAFRLTGDPYMPYKGGSIIQDDDVFHVGVKVCSISKVPPEERLQYLGFCAWTLAQTNGVLILGDISIGLLSFENRFYSFLSASAAHKWATNPNLYTKMIMDNVRGKPELMRLLNMADDLKPKRKDDKESNVGDDRRPETSNVEIQTDLHPIESHLSRNYTFSEWELRRRALKLANLTRCVTKSQQTVKSSFNRSEVGVQIATVFSKETQTRRATICRNCFRNSP